MRAPLLAILSVTLLLGACSSVRELRLNPFNWFGGSTEERVAPLPEGVEPADPRPLVADVTDLAVEKMPGGAIVRATGLPERQGYWLAELVAENGGVPQEGTLVYSFRVAPPDTATAVGNAASREVTAADFLSDQDLAAIRTIVVRGRQNQRSVRR